MTAKQELALIEEAYNAAQVAQLRNNIQGQLWNRIDPDSLYFSDELNGDFVTFGFVNTDYQDSIGIAMKEENHTTMLVTAFRTPQVIIWEDKPIKLPRTAVFSIRGRAAMFYYHYRDGQTVEVPVIAFWEKWNETKDLLQKSIDLIQKTDPDKHYPNPGKEWYIATADKTGWLDEIDQSVADLQRMKEGNRLKNIHDLMPAEKNKALKAMGAKPKTVDAPVWKKVIGDSTHQAEDRLIAERYINR